jgi:hypothetical protein
MVFVVTLAIATRSLGLSESPNIEGRFQMIRRLTGLAVLCLVVVVILVLLKIV